MLSRDFLINKKKIQIQQNLDYGHAGSVWDAALVFAHYLEKNCAKLNQNQFFSGKSILELGSGTGVAGLLTTAFNPKQIILTDMEENQELLKINIQNNKNSIANDILVENTSLEWGHENNQKLKEIIQKYGNFDIILGSDLMYDDKNSFKLLETFEQLSKLQQNCLFFLVFNIRKESEREIIKRIENAFKLEYISEQDYDELYRDEDIGIMMFRRKEN